MNISAATPSSRVQRGQQHHTCYPRRRFTSSQAASAAARNIAANNGQHRLAEPCSKCNGWHLSAPIEGGK